MIQTVLLKKSKFPTLKEVQEYCNEAHRDCEIISVVLTRFEQPSGLTWIVTYIPKTIEII